MVDKNVKVIISSPETERAGSYADQLYGTMVPRVLSWNDASKLESFSIQGSEALRQHVFQALACDVRRSKQQFAERLTARRPAQRQNKQIG
jgi:hypothetical protein